MSLFQVPTVPNLPWYSFKITLSGVIFTVTLRYNPRMERWLMDIGDPSNQPILSGLPILINRNVNGQYVVSGVPSGFFFATDDTGQFTQPTLNSFQLDHSLLYNDPTT